MSHQKISELVLRIMEEEAIKYVNKIGTVKEGGTAGAGTGTSTRYNMDKLVSILEIDPENLMKGSQVIVKDKKGNESNRYTINKKQANMLAEAFINFLLQDTPLVGKFDNDGFEEILAASKILAIVPKTGAKRVRSITKTVRKFQAHYNAAADEVSVKILAGGSGVLVEDRVTALFIADKFGILRTETSKFAYKLQAFMEKQDYSAKFYGVFSTHDIIRATNSRALFSSGMGTNIQELFGTKRSAEGSKTFKPTSRLSIGHIGSETDTSKRSVAQVSIDSTLNDIPASKSLLRNRLSKYMSDSQLQRLIADMMKVNKEKHAEVYSDFYAKLTKNTSNLERLKLAFEGVISFNLHTQALNSSSARMGNMLSSLAAREYEAKKDILNEKTVNRLLKTQKIEEWQGSPSWLSGVFSTITDAIVSKMPKSRKGFRIRKPKTAKGTDTTTIVKKRKKLKVKNRIKEELRNVKPPKIENSARAATISLNITIPEDIVEKEDTCTISPQKLLEIQGRLNYALHDAIKANMKKPALVYRTGRFAKSVKVAGIKQLPDCSLIAYYRYMVAPYAVFDPSISSYRGLSSPTRNPQKIIGDSIRSIAQGIMKDRYTIHPQWI